MIDQLLEDISRKHGKILKVHIQTKHKSRLVQRINEKAYTSHLGAKPT